MVEAQGRNKNEPKQLEDNLQSVSKKRRMNLNDCVDGQTIGKVSKRKKTAHTNENIKDEKYGNKQKQKRTEIGSANVGNNNIIGAFETEAIKTRPHETGLTNSPLTDDEEANDTTYDSDTTNLSQEFKSIQRFCDLLDFRHNNKIKLYNTEENSEPKLSSKTLKKYLGILDDLNIEFTKDLPTHLYNAHLLSTRNKNLPPAEFTLWPLKSSELISPIDSLRTVSIEKIKPDADLKKIKDSKYSFIDYEVNNKLEKPHSSMLQLWHPQIDAISELYSCMDSVHEREINHKISKYAEDHKLTSLGQPRNYTYQRSSSDDIKLDSFSKERIKSKLDSVIDCLVDMHTNCSQMNEDLGSKLRYLTKSRSNCIPDYGLDWINVLASLDVKDMDSKEHLKRMFKLALKKDHNIGPVESYPPEFQLYENSRTKRDKRLRKLIDTPLKDSKIQKLQEQSTKTQNVSVFIPKIKKSHQKIMHSMETFTELSLKSCKQTRRSKKSSSTDL